jgi:hypothetical protein
MVKDDFTISELWEISDEREQWAQSAHDKDLHGSAKEYELTAAIARFAARLLEKEEPPRKTASELAADYQTHLDHEKIRYKSYHGDEATLVAEIPDFLKRT